MALKVKCICDHMFTLYRKSSCCMFVVLVKAVFVLIRTLGTSICQFHLITFYSCFQSFFLSLEQQGKVITEARYGCIVTLISLEKCLAKGPEPECKLWTMGFFMCELLHFMLYFIIMWQLIILYFPRNVFDERLINNQYKHSKMYIYIKM